MLRRIETVENIPDFLEGVKNREEKLMGFGHRVYKNYDPRARIIKKHVDEVLEATERQPADRDRDRAREAGARRRLLHLAQALPERRLLLGPDLRGARDPDRDVHGDLRDPADLRLGRAVAGDDRRLRAEDRPAAPDLHRRARRRLRADRRARRRREDHRRRRRSAAEAARAAAPERLGEPTSSRSGTGATVDRETFDDARPTPVEALRGRAEAVRAEGPLPSGRVDPRLRARRPGRGAARDLDRRPAARPRRPGST